MKHLILTAVIFSAYSSLAQTQWKQQVDTKIDVTLDDKKHMLYAAEEFTYTNNSPDTLKFLYIHLWPNAYKNDHTPFAKQQDLNGNTAFYYSKPEDKGYIDSLQFTVDGNNVDYYSTEDAPDIARIDLIQPLLPGGKIKVATPFRVKLPAVFSRSGHTGQAYYAAQWFPKPAVYDRKGWHPISYLDQGEFFSDYGAYDVSIILPANYVVMATGNCLDESENKWLDSLSNVPHAKAQLALPEINAPDNSFPQSALQLKTLHYHEDNIHDFAWFADKRFIVRKDTVTSPGNGLLVTTWAAFLPGNEYWYSATDYLAAAVTHYGKWVGPYQYKTLKAVQGDMHAGGGMEYPTVTLIDRTIKSNLKTVAVHEAGHNWFYGMLGSNERDHAWMDEGINTFYEQKTTRGFRKDTAYITVGLDETMLYYERAATHTDQAIDQNSANFEKMNYGIDVYYKTSLMLNWLEKYMGEQDFAEGMKDYYNTWLFRHPYPEDFRAAMQRHTAKPLDWFFDTILNTDKKIDYKVKRARVKDNNTELVIHNNSHVYAPVKVEAYKNDSLIALAWTPPFDHSAKLSMPVTDWDRLRISDIIPDARSANDVYRRHALFHHFGINVKPFLGLNVGEKDKVFVAPSFGNNIYDGFMAGLLFHNLTLPENRFRFAITPLYSFPTETMNGAGSVGYVWYPNSFIKEIMLQGDAKSFHFNETLVNLKEPLYARYIKLAPSLNFIFNEHDLRSPVTRMLTFKGYDIYENNIVFSTDPAGMPQLKQVETKYALIRYKHRNERVYNPFSYDIEAHGNADFAKITAEGKVRIDYNTKGKALSVRGFAGKFFAVNDDPATVSRYLLNASYNGMDDYLYDGTYRARNSTSRVASHQISIQEGGFKIPVYNGVNRSDNWMATFNLETDLPLRKLPIRLFFDAGLLPNYNQGYNNINNRKLIYDGGVQLYFSDAVSIYFPLIMSGEFRDYLTNTFGKKNVLARSISFTMQLQNVNWLRTPSWALKNLVK